MNFQFGKNIYEQVQREECLKYLFQKQSLFVIHKKYENALLLENSEGIAHLFSLGILTVPISNDDTENEQVFYGDLRNLKIRNNDKNIENYIFFKGVKL